MCTVFFLKKAGLLSKNRDKEKVEVEEVIRTPEIIAVRTQGASYFSLGINQYGCAFVSTAVNSPEWTAAVEGGQLKQAKRIMNAETDGRIGPTSLLSELLPKIKSVDEWLDAIKNSKFKWRGYNLIMVDTNTAIHIEAFDRQTSFTQIDDHYICTNHFNSLEWGAQKPVEYQNSFDRFYYAQEKLPSIKNRSDLFAVIAPIKKRDKRRIWRTDMFQTISSTVIDLHAKALYRCTDATGTFEKITL